VINTQNNNGSTWLPVLALSAERGPGKLRLKKG